MRSLRNPYPGHSVHIWECPLEGRSPNEVRIMGAVLGAPALHCRFSSLVPWTWRHRAHQNGVQRKLIFYSISSCVSFLHHTMVPWIFWSWLDCTTTICDRLKDFFTPFLPRNYFMAGREITTGFISWPNILPTKVLGHVTTEDKFQTLHSMYDNGPYEIFK